jgi:NadR type nicotinamide-nucleotide adenylyltransferase
MAEPPATGFLLGKFLPPHRGHQYLIEFARAYVDRLTVLVCTIAREPIAGDLRYQWMCEAFPGVDLVHHTDELPHAPEEHPRFWDLWRASIRRHVPGRIDYVFASETYGWRLAAELDARFVPVDIERRNVPVSGRAIRADPLAHWADLLPPVRPYYAKRVCVVDPAHPALARELARQLDTPCLHAYGRADEDFASLLRAQAAAETALLRQANRVLVAERDALTSALLAELRDGVPADESIRPYDFYLLGDAVDDRLTARLLAQHLPVQTLHGAAAARLAQAGAVVARLLGGAKNPSAPASAAAPAAYSRRQDDAASAATQANDGP